MSPKRRFATPLLTRRWKARRGSAFAAALVALVFVMLAGGGLMSFSGQAMRRGRYDILRPRALSLAEAGLERALYYLRTTAPDGTTNGSWRTASLTETLGDGRYTLTVSNGTGANSGLIVVTSTGRISDGTSTSYDPVEVRRTIRMVVEMTREDISIWNNAIFGGVGQSGKSINGNVRIRGSVHLLGDGEDFTDTDGDGKWDAGESFTDLNGNGKWDLGETYTDADGDGKYDAPEPYVDVNGNGSRDPALTVTDLSSEFAGTANIGNNYDGMPWELRSRIPDPPTRAWDGETIETLNAKLRVKHGTVSLSGTATVGQPNYTGAPYYKETMDRAYVSDGFTGTAGPRNVYSDNGTKSKYDLGEILDFPTLVEPTQKGGYTYDSYMAYLRTSGLEVTGPLTFKPGTSYGPISDGRGNYLAVDAEGNVTIRGIVYVNGNVSFVPDGGKKDMRYTGRGTLVTTGDLSVETNLISKETFPTRDVMGFIARRNMSLGTSSQLMLSGAFYCQQTISSTKQNELLGTFVSSYFSMKNVPHMYQVPALVDNMPPGMPGDQRIWIKSLRILSWKEA